MKRREFIIVIVIGGTAAAWSLAASAERAARVPPVKQIRLTERQIQGFIAAQKERGSANSSNFRAKVPSGHFSATAEVCAALWEWTMARTGRLP